MSANSSDRLRPLCLLLLALCLPGCVTNAEQAASQSDISWFARTLNQDPFSNLDPDSFQTQAQEMIRTPIEFHGRVLSEEGNPIKGAVVKPAIFDRLVDPFEFPYFSYVVKEALTTGDNGRFRISGVKGAGMYVTVEVPGWQPVTSPRKLYAFAEGLNQAPSFPTRSDPAIFQFERRPPEAQLRPIKTGALRLTKDGTPLEISLRTVAPYGVDPGTGDAIIACERTVPDATPEARFDWWCELTVPGGGFQLFKIDMDRAPETGYVETARLAFNATEPRWDDRADRDLIIKFADGKYGSLVVSMRMDGDFYVAFDGIWNPTGSTWLD